MANTTYNTTEDKIIKLKSSKCKTNLKICKNLSNYFYKMNIKIDEDTFAKHAQDISKKYHKVLMLLKVLQTKPQFKNMNNIYCDLYYTVIKNRNEEKCD